MAKQAENLPKLVEIHARLFAEDIEELQQRARSKGSNVGIELRVLVRRALKEPKLKVLDE